MDNLFSACSVIGGCVLWVWLVGTKDQFQLLTECLIAIGHSDIGDVGACDVITGHTFFIVVLAQPVLLHLGGGGRPGRGKVCVTPSYNIIWMYSWHTHTHTHTHTTHTHSAYHTHTHSLIHNAHVHARMHTAHTTPCAQIRSWQRCSWQAHTCPLCSASIPEQQCCTPPSEAPGHRGKTVHGITHTLTVEPLVMRQWWIDGTIITRRCRDQETLKISISWNGGACVFYTSS